MVVFFGHVLECLWSGCFSEYKRRRLKLSFSLFYHLLVSVLCKPWLSTRACLSRDHGPIWPGRLVLFHFQKWDGKASIFATLLIIWLIKLHRFAPIFSKTGDGASPSHPTFWSLFSRWSEPPNRHMQEVQFLSSHFILRSNGHSSCWHSSCRVVLEYRVLFSGWLTKNSVLFLLYDCLFKYLTKMNKFILNDWT